MGREEYTGVPVVVWKEPFGIVEQMPALLVSHNLPFQALQSGCGTRLDRRVVTVNATGVPWTAFPAATEFAPFLGRL